MKLDDGSDDVTIEIDDSGDTDFDTIKLKNSAFADNTEGRGAVDDLINLTHLHEPAILNVMVR